MEGLQLGSRIAALVQVVSFVRQVAEIAIRLETSACVLVALAVNWDGGQKKGRRKVRYGLRS